MSHHICDIANQDESIIENDRAFQLYDSYDGHQPMEQYSSPVAGRSSLQSSTHVFRECFLLESCTDPMLVDENEACFVAAIDAGYGDEQTIDFSAAMAVDLELAPNLLGGENESEANRPF